MLAHCFGKATSLRVRLETALTTLMRMLVVGGGFGHVAVHAGRVAAFTLQLQRDMRDVVIVAQYFVYRAPDLNVGAG